MEIERIVVNKFLETHPVDAVRILEKLPIEETAPMLEATPPALAARVMQLMDLLTATRCLISISPDKAGAMMERLPVELSAMLLRRIEDPQRASILEKTPPEVEDRLRRVLYYPEGTAGALMDAGVFTLLEDFTVKEALQEVREHAHQLTRYLYVLNREKRLIGVLNLRELFLASPNARVASIMHTDVQKLFAYTDLQAVQEHPGWLAHHALPVVEEGDLLVGALRYKTLRRLEQESAGKKPYPIAAAGMALGELYQIGLTGLIRGAISPTGSPQERSNL